VVRNNNQNRTCPPFCKIARVQMRSCPGSLCGLGVLGERESWLRPKASPGRFATRAGVAAGERTGGRGHNYAKQSQFAESQMKANCRPGKG